MAPRSNKPVVPEAPSTSSAVQAMLDKAAADSSSSSKPSKKKKSGGAGFSLDFGALKIPAMIVGGLALLFGAYSFVSAPIDRAAALEQIEKYYQEIKSTRASKDKEKLKALRKRIRSETREIATALTKATSGGSSGAPVDRTILYLIDATIPEAIKAPMDDTVVIGIVERQIKEVKDAL